ncbi:MAG: isoprenylcysteine carboxylmethyltransferase family protein [Patulibacter sp.]|nr:isoprenylcysteine carboxylmethyltransferase family protein [Patulibacter sp.]
MPILALVLYAVFFALAFGWRSWRQFRITGSSGFQGISGRPGSAEWWGGVLFVVAIVLGVAGPVVQLTGTLDPLSALDTPGAQVVGIALATSGIVVTVLSQLAMDTSWRVGIDESTRTDLVTHGVFGLVRNPIFSGMVVCAAGLALLAPNLLSLAGLLVLVLAIQLQVRRAEEPFLRRTLGAPYVDYASRVGRFVPGVGRLARG